MDSLKEEEEGKAFPPLSPFSVLGFFEGFAVTLDLGCENDWAYFRATPHRRGLVTRQFPSPSSLALPWG